VYILIISHPVLLRMRKVSDKSRRENQNTHFAFSNFSFENSDFNEIPRKYVVDQDRPQMKIMEHAHCMLDTYNYKHILRIFKTY